MRSFALIAAGLAGAALLAVPAEAGDRPAVHPCATATERCAGTVSVPLDRADPGGERIDVAFVRVPARDRSRPAEGTVLAHLGGPAPSLSGADGLAAELGPALDHQDLVLADLRGMGESSPLDCGAVDLGDPAAVTACAEALGPRGTFFSTDRAVDDYDAVRAALGVDRVTLFGNSYGTELAQAYASRYPHRVAAVLLNGAPPITATGHVSALGPIDTVTGGLRSLARDCAASPRCAALPGDTTDRVVAVLPDLRASGDAPRLVAVLEDAVFEPAVGRTLDAALAAHAGGDPAPLRRLLDATRPSPGPRVLPARRAASFLTYTCGDADLPYDRSAPEQERREQLAAFHAGEPYAPFTRDEVVVGSFAVDPRDLCVGWPLLRDSAPVLLDAAFPDVPVLQLAGGGDPLTALDEGAAAARFPRATYRFLPAATHQPWDDDHPVAGRCAHALVAGFLAAPRHDTPDTGCDWTNYRPVGSLPAAAADLPGGVLGAAVATAVDATMPLHTFDPATPEEYVLAGPRGGEARLATGVVTLAGYRLAADAPVDGTITVSAGRVHADLTVAGHRVQVSWDLYDAADPLPVTGTVDGEPVDTAIPRT